MKVVRTSLQDQIRANKRASLIYATFLILLLTAFGAVLGGYYAPDLWFLGAAGAFLLGLITAVIARFASSSIVLAISGARDATDAEHRVLNNVAEEMAIAAGIPRPRVMIIDDSAPNAFATGSDPSNAVVVFTTGILEKLDRDELQGVMAHEIAHIRNYDIRFMSTIAMIAGLIPLLSDFLWHSLRFGGGRRSKESNQLALIFLVFAILFAIFAPIFAKLLEMAVSRKRELLADSTAAELTRYPEGLASALMKISRDSEHLEAANRATQHMYIVNPMKLNADLDSWMSTHPPVSQRVAALRSIMGTQGTALSADPWSDLPQDDRRFD